MSTSQTPNGPSLDEVTRYLAKFQAPAQLRTTAASADVHPDAQPKYRSPHEGLWRRRVVQVALPICLCFLACAGLSLLLQRSIAPLHVGSHMLIEWVMQRYPSAYMFSALHNFILATVAGGFAVAASRGHMEIPGTPHRKETLVSRRTARFAYRQFMSFLLLMGLGVPLRVHDWLFLAAVFQSAALVCLLDMAANLWLPVLRMFLVVELDLAHDGLMNRIVIGHGRAWRRGTVVILHDRLIEVTSFASPLEACLGLRSLRLVFWDDAGRERIVELRALGLADMVSEIEHLLKGQFRSARGTSAIANGNSLQPTMNIIQR